MSRVRSALGQEEGLEDYGLQVLWPSILPLRPAEKNMLISGMKYLIKIHQKRFLLSAWKHLVSESKPTIYSKEEKADQ